MATKRKHEPTVEEEVIDESDNLLFFCLGGGNEVGRSCHILQYKGKTVMLDAGVHPAYDGLAALPFYDEFDLSTVDVLLISHFHLDHAASLPYVMSKTNFKGRVFMTHPTKAIYKWLIQDSVRLGNVHNTGDSLFTEADHLSSYSRIEAIDYHTTLTHSGISITPYHAGHVLGGAMFFIEIAGLKILFTGDYSREDDRHLVSAEVPPVKPDVLICESTYGTASHMPRIEREQRLMTMTTEILLRGGRVLMPVFALGRAQELLLILDEYWDKNPKFQTYPIYYASNLARKCMDVYRTYINTMNDKIKRAMFEGEGRNPWDFKWIRSLKSIDRFEDVGGCVMLASPGMLQNGVARELLERWAPDPRNGLIITGYSVEGTMAKQIMNEPPEIPAVMTANRAGASSRDRGDGGGGMVMVPRRMSVEELSFAAHVDYAENSGFIEEVGAKVVILVHGEQNNMGRLKSALLSRNHEKREKDRIKIYNPKNCEELRIPFRGEKVAKVVGKLAQKPPEKGQLLKGVLVQNDFKLSLMAPEDLREYAGLTTTVVTCKQKIPIYAAGLGLIRWSLEAMFGAVINLDDDDDDLNGDDRSLNHNHNHNHSHNHGETRPSQLQGGGEEEDDDDYDPEKEMRDDTPPVQQEEEEAMQREEEGETGAVGKNGRATGRTFRIMDSVTVRCRRNYVELEWVGNLLNDGIADALMAVLYSLEGSPAAVKQSSKNHSHSHSHAHAHDDDTALSSIKAASPHAHVTFEQRLQRILWFLDAQFGNCVSPLEPPKSLPPPPPPPPTTTSTDPSSADHDMTNTTPPDSTATTRDRFGAQGDGGDKAGAEEDIMRFAPGVQIKIDSMVAKVYFETLEVECRNESLRMRVKSVVERAVETVAPFTDLVGAAAMAGL